MTLEIALAAIKARIADRADAFLDSLERTVLAHAGSPYRALLEGAGYDLPRLRALVAREGVEDTLRRLCRDGVYISIEEFKGIRDVRRGNRTFRFEPAAFNNPLIRHGLQVLSGGTRSGRIPTMISHTNHRMGIEHLAAALSAYEIAGRPVVVWLPQAHGASLWAVLALANLGMVTPRWFTQLPVRFGGIAQIHSYYPALRAAAGLNGVKLPPLTHVPLGQESRILRWIREGATRQGCGVFTTPSSALRLAVAAKQLRVSLSNVTFVTIAEPLTPAKAEAIQAAGARAFSSLGFTEFGRATYGCAAPDGPDDMHICHDALAVIHHRRAVDQMGTEMDALLFTSVRADARKILLNAETGDYATMSARRCGCPLETAGWPDHLHDVRSFEKLNAEGRLFFGSQLISLVEEVLPGRFGGDPTDYQLVEQEDGEGFTRLSILVHPRIGRIDERAIVECVEESLRVKHEANTRVWKEAGTVRVRRAAPMLTKAGKLVPLHHLGSVAAPSPGS